MIEESRSEESSVSRFSAAAVASLSERLGDLTGSVQHMLITEIAELNGDVQLMELLRDTVESNIETVFSAIRHGIPVERIEPPTAALEHARRLAQREVSVNALVRAYRLGHKAVLRELLAEVREQALDARLSLAVYGQIAEITFGYIDEISQQVVATYQDERDGWLQNRNRLRALRVREILNGGEVDIDAATMDIQYPLRRIQLAVTLWRSAVSDAGDLASFEHHLRHLAEAVGSRESPLFIPEDSLTAMGWIPLESEQVATAIATIRAVSCESKDGPRLAIGNPLPGLEGFRRSHRQAQDARAVAVVLGAAAPRVIAAGDHGLSIAAMLGADIDAAGQWVTEVLGPLADPTDNDELLRQTLQIFLRTGSSFKAAAEELHLHYNSVKYRIQRAIMRRGRPITDDDRVDVEVALLLCKWYGTAVLN